MVTYFGHADFKHGDEPAVGVLIANLGTPDAPTEEALRPYLAKFLADPRVIELPPWKWMPVLHGVVLRTRPKKSAELYKKVWTDEGSPLLVITKKQTDAIRAILEEEIGTPVHVAFGMRIGNPGMEEALRDLSRKGCRRILVLPMFPQYSGTTVASVWDALADELKQWRWVPELRFMHHYHDEPGYIEALANTVREAREKHGAPDKLVMSFHGIPLRYFENGDPYFCECHKTARLLAEAVGLSEDEYVVTFQSLFGKEEWVKPYTDRTLEALARSGATNLHVIAPAFSADCLETLEELDETNRELFMHAGGEKYHYIPALNDRPDHVRFLADLVKRNLAGWIRSPEEYDAEHAAQEADASKARAAARKAQPAPADGGFGGA